jgi:hypothetical protein
MGNRKLEALKSRSAIGEKITVFYGSKEKLNGLKETLSGKVKHIDYTEFDFHNVSTEDRIRFGGESRIIINTFARFAVRTIAGVKGEKMKGVTAFVDGFISHIDEAEAGNALEYITALADVCDVFYFAHHECDRLDSLNSTIFEIN